MSMTGCFASDQFQSTLSVRRATIMRGRVAAVERISIHALRKESDRLSDVLRFCR